MQIQTLGTHSKAADVPLEQLSHNKTLSEPEKVHELCRQFEAVLLREILNQAQKHVIASKIAPENVSSGIYHDMLTTQLADSISKTGSVGLTSSLERQLSNQISTDSDRKTTTA